MPKMEVVENNMEFYKIFCCLLFFSKNPYVFSLLKFQRFNLNTEMKLSYTVNFFSFIEHLRKCAFKLSCEVG